MTRGFKTKGFQCGLCITSLTDEV